MISPANGSGDRLARRRQLHVMGIVNVTPDSFSDGGLFGHSDAAVRRGLELHDAGADFVDVGGESTRPGAPRIDLGEELRRIEPVVKRLSAKGVRVSIDTTRSRVAAAALAAGAVMVNDVSGGLADPNMARVVRDGHCLWILTHNRGVSSTMQRYAHYDDVTTDVIAELTQRIDAALAAGVPVGALILDPGLGFAKRAEHNWELLAQLDRIRDVLGLPILIGASRKSFLGELLRDEQNRPRPTNQREDATTAITTVAAAKQIWGVRVHEVAASIDAARVVAAITDHAMRPAPDRIG